jgi:heat shock protein HslJ
MKTQLFIVLLAIFSISAVSCKSSQKAQKKEVQATGDNSMNALDWDGTYQGILPCADCEGIQTQITLNKDLSYVLETRYNGKDEKVFQTKGTFNWGINGSKITLDNSEKQSYLVGENMLFHLDKNGNRITGDLANKYVLGKEKVELNGKYWKLIELNGEAVKVENREPFIKFNTEEKLVNGNSSCNSFNGNYEISEGNKISISPFMMTRMACIDNNIEGEFMQALEATTGYLLSANTLVFTDSTNKNLAKFKADFFK